MKEPSRFYLAILLAALGIGVAVVLVYMATKGMIALITFLCFIVVCLMAAIF